MSKKKNDQKSDSKDSMSNTPDREFETQGNNPGFSKGSQQPGVKQAGSPSSFEDDDMSTAGGREGNFSDKNRGNQGQWSPGSTQPSDE